MTSGEQLHKSGLSWSGISVEREVKFNPPEKEIGPIGVGSARNALLTSADKKKPKIALETL
jgi:hypothetical protein